VRIGTVNVDYNGLVLFDPASVIQRFGPLAPGTDLFSRFISSEEGDEALRHGIVVPVLAVDDAGYDVVVRLASEPARIQAADVICENGIFALRVCSGHVIVADLSAIMDWIDEPSGLRVPVEPGNYSVRIRGYRRVDWKHRVLKTAGYEFVLRRVRRLPRVSGKTDVKMRTLNWWDDEMDRRTDSSIRR
jgi:hypothetical protein